MNTINKLIRTNFGLNAILVCLILFFAFKLCAELLTPTAVIETKRSSMHQTSKLATSWQWFGRDNDLGNTPEQPLHQSTLNAQLLGIVGLGQSNNKVALIQVSGQPQKVYRVGAQLNNIASLEQIYSDRITIRENGVLTSLSINKNADADRASALPNTQRSQASTHSDLQISGMARAVPVTVDGQVGMRLEALNSDVEALSALQRDDIVMSVAGQDVAALVSQQNWQSLLSETDAKVSLMRNGKPVSIQVNIASLAQHMLQEIQNN